MARRPHQPKKYAWPLSLMAPWLPVRKSKLGAVDTPLSKKSRLQRRLKKHRSSDLAFYDLVQRRHAQPSRLNRRLNRRVKNERSQPVLWQRFMAGFGMVLAISGLVWTHLFIQEQVTLAGVPYGIVRTFWNDKPARTAYFSGDRQALHGRLRSLGVEADIKAYYRDHFSNEYELDKHIHQIMFDRTGYVGEAYQVDNFGRLDSVEY